jgi:hypothetical protein
LPLLSKISSCTSLAGLTSLKLAHSHHDSLREHLVANFNTTRWSWDRIWCKSCWAWNRTTSFEERQASCALIQNFMMLASSCELLKSWQVETRGAEDSWFPGVAGLEHWREREFMTINKIMGSSGLRVGKQGIRGSIVGCHMYPRVQGMMVRTVGPAKVSSKWRTFSVRNS